tara:strand:+ start:221177 stop:222034 length:858 start_codon:yes stop_codon:yes gene_type:complete
MMNSKQSFISKTVFTGIVVFTLGACAPEQSPEMQTAEDSTEAQMQYPDWRGQWNQHMQRLEWPTNGYEVDGPPPLNAEYMARWEETHARADAGIPPDEPTQRCLPQGMPRIMKAVYPMEFIITPETTYIYAEWNSQFRRIYTDGRDWPGYTLPSFNGYSIGEWHDQDGDGTYDMLSVETRFLKGPRLYDGQWVPFHDNNETVILEEISRVDENTMMNVVTTIDDALTGPWEVTQYYGQEEEVIWQEYACAENNSQLRLGDEWYFITEDGNLEPTREGQPRLVPEF